VVDLVDSKDRPIGRATLQECLEKGLRHRAVAVVVFRSSGRIILQKRSPTDSWHPGLWTLSCTGHVKSGESYVGAARRELAEELGLHAVVRLVGKYLLPKISAGGLTEWEVVALYVSDSDAPTTMDRVELEEVKELSPAKAKRMLGGRKLTPDAKILLKELFNLPRHNPGSGRTGQSLQGLLKGGDNP
jgi:isopentenyldiphosphate isomerase